MAKTWHAMSEDDLEALKTKKYHEAKAIGDEMLELEQVLRVKRQERRAARAAAVAAENGADAVSAAEAIVNASSAEADAKRES